MIAIDSIFPIKRVNFHVENARVGPTTDYDKLTLEIWTDGTISPRDALSNAAGFFVNISISSSILKSVPMRNHPAAAKICPMK